MELSKALSHTDYAVRDAEKFPLFPLGGADSTSFMASSEAVSLALNCCKPEKFTLVSTIFKLEFRLLIITNDANHFPFRKFPIFTATATITAA